MHFLLTTLKVAYVLSTPRPEFVEEETLKQIRKRCKWDNDEFTYCSNGANLNKRIQRPLMEALFEIRDVALWKEAVDVEL
ncbi:hypothetical protein Tco_0687812 [Tanacetum coccineum]